MLREKKLFFRNNLLIFQFLVYLKRCTRRTKYYLTAIFYQRSLKLFLFFECLKLFKFITFIRNTALIFVRIGIKGFGVNK